MELPILNHMQTRNAVITISVISALALLTSVASVALDINEVVVERIVAGEPTAAADAQTATASYKVNEIVAVHMMGNPARARPVRVERAPKTKLNLTLKGLLSTHDQEIARAIIAIGNKPDRLYGVGDKLESGNATVKEIQDDLVLLDRNGKVESLPLPKKLTSDMVSSDALYIPADAATTEQAIPASTVPVQAAVPAESLPANIPPARSIPQNANFSELQRMRDAAKNNPTAPVPEGQTEAEQTAQPEE